MDDDHREFVIEVANEKHYQYAPLISMTMQESAKARGTGIGKRSPELLISYMQSGNALVATDEQGRWAGFCYIAVWDNGLFVSSSGLIVNPDFRECGLASKLKKASLQLCKEKYPQASIIGITTSAAVMKINTSLGFHPTTFADMPKDEKFWKGCESCVNYDILKRTEGKYCLCTAMRLDRRDAMVAAQEPAYKL